MTKDNSSKKILYFSLAAIVIMAALITAITLTVRPGRRNCPAPTPEMTDEPQTSPSEIPSEPTATPTAEPTETPTAEPTETPTAVPTETPAPTPTAVPTAAPTPVPTPKHEPGAKATPAPIPTIKLKHKGNPTDKMIAFTFDDGPTTMHNGTTERLLDGLKERNIKATFFVIGEQLDKNNPRYYSELVRLLKREHDEGHLIGNHSYSHPNFQKISEEEIYSQINKTNDVIESITGERPVFLRCPYGKLNRDIMAAIGMINVYWGSFDCEDWNKDGWLAKHPGGTDEEFTRYICDYIVERAQDGDIVLMHDIYRTSVDAALMAMDILKERGFRFVTVDELLMRNAGENLTPSTTYLFSTMRPGDTSGLVEK